MRIFLASSEVHPYSKTGGLADMVGALAKALAKAGHEVSVITPLYSGIREKVSDLKETRWKFDLPLGNESVRATIWETRPAPRLRILFVDQPEFFLREGLYQDGGRDHPDNARRFIFFAKVVAHLAHVTARTPDIVHVHDWQVGLVPLLIRFMREREGWGNAPRTLLTIHNLAFQGVFPAIDFGLTNLPLDYFSTAYAEFYLQLNCLKAGIMSADALTTVSPRYAREITTEELGCGLDGCLRARQAVLHGILNGVDYEEWNTDANPFLRQGFTADSLDGKRTGKLKLLREIGLPAVNGAVNGLKPLFGTISRLADQKGIDILLPALEEMLPTGLQFTLLGTGSTAFEMAARELALRYPKQVSVKVGFDTGLSHRIEAGCDFFLMPSRFEPCGLNQMYSLRYGTIPIVRRTGGLDDSVVDATDDPRQPNGIKFDTYSGRSLANAIRKGLTIYERPELLRHYQRNGMRADFSWDRTRAEYEAVYREALGD